MQLGFLEKLKLKFNNKFTIFATIIIIIVILTASIFLYIWIKDVYDTYINSKKYKEAYIVVIQQKEYCDSIQNKPQTKENFIYCDKFYDAFKDVIFKN